MGSLLGNWPSYDPHNFSQIRPSDPSHPSKLTSATYHATHGRALPPQDQVNFSKVQSCTVACRNRFKFVDQLLRLIFLKSNIEKLISNESENILLRHFYQSTEKKLRPKRGASDNLVADHSCKQPRNSSADDSE